MNLFLCGILLSIIGFMIVISIPIFLLGYFIYIFFLETSVKEVALYTWIYDNIANRFFRKIPFQKSTRVIFADKGAIDCSGQQYMYALHPHGLIAQGRIIHTANPDSDLYPYFNRSYQAVHSIIFRIPILRELALLGKCIPADQEFIKEFIKLGHNVSIYPGGVKEIKYCSEKRGEKEDYYYLARRKGFVRIAQALQVPIVPIIFWNEQRMLTYKSSNLFTRIDKLIAFILGQSWNTNVFQALSIKNLRQFWNMLFSDETGEKMAVYVGKPVNVSGMTLKDGHSLYVDALKELYEQAKVSEKSDRELVIM